MMCGSNGVTINQANTAILYVATNKKAVVVEHIVYNTAVVGIGGIVNR